MNTRLTTEWIKYAQEFLKEEALKARSYYPSKNDTLAAKERRKRYEKSEKGKIARKRVLATRAKRIRDYKISKEQKKLLKKFYAECLFGYEVDHIISLRIGGKHELSNLQWLPKKIHGRKKRYFTFGVYEFPQCYIDINKYCEYKKELK